jgi:hypothetical protein
MRNLPRGPHFTDLPEGAPRLPERYRVGEELDGRGSWQSA